MGPGRGRPPDPSPHQLAPRRAGSVFDLASFESSRQSKALKELDELLSVDGLIGLAGEDLALAGRRRAGDERRHAADLLAAKGQHVEREGTKV